MEHGSQGSSEHDLTMDEADNVIAEDPAMAEEEPEKFATKEDEVARLKATIAELTKQQASSKAVVIAELTKQEASSKAVVRRPPAFEGVPRQTVGVTVKTKKVSDLGKGGNSSSPTTRNKGKAEKVRTRSDGPLKLWR